MQCNAMQYDISFFHTFINLYYFWSKIKLKKYRIWTNQSFSDYYIRPYYLYISAPWHSTFYKIYIQRNRHSTLENKENLTVTITNSSIRYADTIILRIKIIVNYLFLTITLVHLSINSCQNAVDSNCFNNNNSGSTKILHPSPHVL